MVPRGFQHGSTRFQRVQVRSKMSSLRPTKGSYRPPDALRCHRQAPREPAYSNMVREGPQAALRCSKSNPVALRWLKDGFQVNQACKRKQKQYKQLSATALATSTAKIAASSNENSSTSSSFTPPQQQQQQRHTAAARAAARAAGLKIPAAGTAAAPAALMVVMRTSVRCSVQLNALPFPLQLRRCLGQRDKPLLISSNICCARWSTSPHPCLPRPTEPPRTWARLASSS